MHRLYPDPAADVDPYDAYRPDDPLAPLVRINMVTTLDGRIAGADGLSGDLGGDADTQAFFAMRHLADGVVAGAGTVRAEGYGPMRERDGWRERRRADGRAGPASIVVVTRSLDVDVDGPLFTEAVAPTLVLTTTDADQEAARRITDAGGVLVRAGEGDVDLAEGFALLRREHGLAHLLVEGGPHLNAQLLDAGLVDELCTTLAPKVVGGEDDARIAVGLSDAHQLRLAQVLRGEDELLLTYRAG